MNTSSAVNEIDAVPGAPARVAAPQPSRTTPPEWRGGSRWFDPRYKSPLIAAMLSFVPGLGQIYVGYYQRGFVHAGVVLTLMAVGSTSSELIGPVLVLSALFVMLYNIVDAGRLAAAYNHVTAGLGRVELPDDSPLPRMEGSIVLGGILALVGLIALSNTLLGIPLRWLEDWWPIFPLVLGAYLLVRGVLDLQEKSSPPPHIDQEESL